MSDTTHVAIAVIINTRNEVCVSLRHKNAHQGGLWEFPGGKIESGETIDLALRREIKEELNLEIIQSRPLITINHHYPDKTVYLHVRKVVLYQGQAIGAEGQSVKWLPISQLAAADFPAANLSVINALQLPDKYLITGAFADRVDFIDKLQKALNNGIKLVQLRIKESDSDSLSQLPFFLEQAATLCSQSKANLMLNLPASCLKNIERSKITFSGFHADSKTLHALKQRPEGLLFSASCHNREELLLATKLKADFVVLSPVQETASHPGVPAMGWQPFSALIENVAMPVYALGGVSEADLDTAWQSGAQGIAAISALWENRR